MNKRILNLVFILMIISLITGCSNKKENINTDAKKFSEEYNISSENPFKYINEFDVINILENGTGIIFFGFNECPWCQRIVPVFNETLKELNINEVYYYNIKDIRERNTLEYQKIVSLLQNHLEKDDNGNKRIFVPDIYFIKSGEVLGHHYGVLEDYTSSDIPLTDDQINRLKEQLKEQINSLYNKDCEC